MVGSSAGAIVATPSLRGTELGDDPAVTPEHYDKKITWSGLNLVPFHIVPHYNSGWFTKEANEMRNYLDMHKIEHKTLKDGQVIVVEGTKVEFLL